MLFLCVYIISSKLDWAATCSYFILFLLWVSSAISYFLPPVRGLFMTTWNHFPLPYVTWPGKRDLSVPSTKVPFRRSCHICWESGKASMQKKALLVIWKMKCKILISIIKLYLNIISYWPLTWWRDINYFDVLPDEINTIQSVQFCH